MYRIPESFNLSDIKDETISQIAFGLNFVTVFFNRGFIQFSGSFVLHVDGKRFDYVEVYPVKNDFGLLKLLEKKIVKVFTNDERNDLTIEFDTGIILQLKSVGQYESYTLNIDGQEVIV
jgi:hypothetical protein